MEEPVVQTVDTPSAVKEVKDETEEQPEETVTSDSSPSEQAAEEDEEEQVKAPPPAAAPPPPPPPAKEPELSPEPPATPAAVPTASFHTVDTRTRSETHGKLRAYEARRRSAYTSKLESSSLYWRSFRDLLHASVHETARAERLVLGSAKANQTYADAMQATYQDTYLDDKGHVVTDPRKQKRLLEQRTHVEEGEKTTKAAEAAEEKRNGMLSSLIDSQAILAERFGENAKHVSTEIASELTALRAELQTQVKSIEKLGNAIVAELENAESEVESAWDSYYGMAVKVMGAGGAPVQSRSPSTAEEKSSALENCADVWVVEMQYRVAVAYQSMAWEKGSTELSKLFASMKEAECQRRVKLREVLIAFLNRQERLFLSLPGIQTPVLKDLVGRQMDRDTIEENVQLSIRKRAQSLQREEAKKTKSPAKGPGLSSARVADGDFKLESPLTSELLCKAKVIERKSMGMMSSWKTTLAVVTADSFLHLFDLPSTKVHSGSAPEVAFQALVPTVTVPTADNIKAGKGASGFLKGWSEHLVPSESLVLANCTIGSGAEAFEISETVCNTGASKMFGKVSTRKILLRAVTKEETTDWIAALKDAQHK